VGSGSRNIISMMIPHPVRCALLALCLVPTLAAAQTPGRNLRNDAAAPIVVTGQPVTREQARERAATFVRQIGVARGDTSAARFIDPVCVRVLGIAESYAALVAERMRAIAGEARITVAPEGCRPNVIVSFVGDASALVRDIARRSPTRFQHVALDQREALLNGNAPIRWWYLTETRSRHSMRNAPQSVQTGSTPGPDGQSTTSSTLDVESLNEYGGGSHISNSVHRAILEANVVIDLDQAEGQTLQAVAAYAAFVAFSEVRPSAPPPTGSILGLFATESGSMGLTDWDLAFLRALYQIPLDRQARRHRGMIVRDMVNFQTRG
jgi:hypothetical protein